LLQIQFLLFITRPENLHLNQFFSLSIRKSAATMASADSKLFKPIKVGNMNLKHRMIMAPLTRFRSDENNVPLLPMVKDYYAQRGSVPGTLLVSEAVFINPQAGGFDYVPGLWDPAQLKNWRQVTDAVHAKGSYIYAQLWCLGRAGGRKVLAKSGLDVVSSSDIPISDKHATPRAMTETEIWSMIGAYAMAARNAVDAGFDGVEIHAANGYVSFFSFFIFFYFFKERLAKGFANVESTDSFHQLHG
jgi:NADPH2 dehydrogenase